MLCLIIYSDESTTLEFVMENLIEVCDHHPQQAEQCAWLLYFNGKCQVKKGEKKQIYPMYKELLSRGLNVGIV